MTYYVNLPDGNKMPFEDDVPQNVALRDAYRAYYAPQNIEQPKAPRSDSSYFPIGYGIDVAQQGLYSALEGAGRGLGIESLAEFGKAGVLRNIREAAESLPESQRISFEQTSLADPSSYAKWFGQTLATTIPQTGASLLAGGIGTVVAGPVGGVAAATAAATPFAYGQHRERVYEEQQKQGIDRDQATVNELKSFGYAIPSAAMDAIADRLTFGLSTGLSRVFKKPVEEVAETVGKTLLPRVAKGIGVGVVSEVPTEVTQQILERAQAGLDLLSDDAFREYKEAAAGAAVIGGTFGGASRGIFGERPAAPGTLGENPELRAALEEARQQNQVVTPIGELTYNDALNFYNNRYKNLSRITKNEGETLALGGVLLERELSDVQGKIANLEQQLETSDNPKKIQKKIDNLQKKIPTLERPRVGLQKELSIFDIQNIKDEFNIPVPPAPKLLAAPDPNARMENLITGAANQQPGVESSFFYLQPSPNKKAGRMVPIQLEGLTDTDESGRRFFRVTDMESGAAFSLPENAIIRRPGRTISTEASTVPKPPPQPPLPKPEAEPWTGEAALPPIVSTGEGNAQTRSETWQGEAARPDFGYTGESQFSARREGAQADTATQADVTSDTTRQAEEAPTAPWRTQAPSPALTVKANKVIDDFLAKLEARGEQGKSAADGVRKAINDRTFSNQQVYTAFLLANEVNRLLPQTANHEIEFVNHLFASDLDAAAKSGGTQGQAVQGLRVAPSMKDGVASKGLIRISLAENMMPIIHETGVHEAYHVLQDYYRKYDPNFNKMINDNFKATHDMTDANGNVSKGMYITEIDKSIINKLKLIKDADGNTYWNKLESSLPNLMSPQEAQAYAFASLYDANRRGAPVTGIKPAYLRFSNFMKSLFTRTKSALNGDGFKTFDEIFAQPRTASFEGKTYPITDANFQKVTQDVSQNIQYSARGDTVSAPELVYQGTTLDESVNRDVNVYEFAADLNSGGYLGISVSVDGNRANVNSIDAIQIGKNPFKYRTSAPKGSRYEDGVRIGYDQVKSLKDRVFGFLKQQHPDISEISGIRATGSRMQALTERGVADTSDVSLKSKIGIIEREPQYSARDVSQYAVRKAAPPGSSTLQKVTGAPIAERSLLSRMGATLTGAREGERYRDALQRNVFNKAYPVWLLENLLRKQGKFGGRSAAQALEIALQNTGRLEQLISHGMISYDPKTGDIDFVKGSKSLSDIFGNRVKDSEVKEFQLYAVALREKDLRAKGRKGFFNITDSEVNDVIKKYNASRPEWKNVTNDLQKFNEGLIKFALDTGLIDQKTANELNSMFYTPYYRQIESDIASSPQATLGPLMTRSISNPKAFPHPLRGGEGAIGDFYQNIFKNADHLLRAGMKNVAMKEVTDLMKIAGLTRQISGKFAKDERVVSFRQNGKEQHYIVDDGALFAALTAIPSQNRQGIVGALDRFAGFFRNSITLTPPFMLANLWRGKVVAYAQEAQPFMSSTSKALLENIKKGGSLKAREISAMTGFGGYTYGMNEKDVAKAFARQMRIAGGEATFMDRIKQGIDGLQRISEATEFAERTKIYDRLLSEGKTKREASWAAYNLAPFGRRGSGEGFLGATLASMIPMVPFLNAKLQGMYRLYEGKPNGQRLLWMPKEIMLRGAVVGFFSMLAAMMAEASDPEAWKNESLDNILNNDVLFYINGNAVQLPRGFEVGTWFGALPVFIYRKLSQEHSPSFAKGFGRMFMNTFGFTPLPAGALPVGEVISNYNVFRGRPIESFSQSKMPIEARINRNTSEAAKAISSALSVVRDTGLKDVPIIGALGAISPVKAQHLLEGYLGTAGTMILTAMDSILAKSGFIPSKPTGAFGDPQDWQSIGANLAGLNRFVKDTGQRGGMWADSFNDLRKNVEETVRYARDMKTSGDVEGLKQLLEQKGMYLQFKDIMQKATQQLSKISKAERVITEDRTGTLSPAKKRELLQPLIEARLRIQKELTLLGDKAMAQR